MAPYPYKSGKGLYVRSFDTYFEHVDKWILYPFAKQYLPFFPNRPAELNRFFQMDRGKQLARQGIEQILPPKQTRRPLLSLLFLSYFYGIHTCILIQYPPETIQLLSLHSTQKRYCILY